MSIIKIDESKPLGPPPAALLGAIDELADQATKDGTLLDQGGLLPSAAGALVRLSGGKVTVTDGPFIEAKELIGGYAMFQLRSKDEAIEMARRFMELHAEHWPEFEGVCEVRQMMEPGDPEMCR
jgi:hypothetical protein